MIIHNCPFCGNDELLCVDEDVPENIRKIVEIVICGHCGTRGPWGHTESEAIELWNKRISSVPAVSPCYSGVKP